MRKILGIAGINAIIFLALLMALNAVAIGGYQGLQLLRSISVSGSAVDPRAHLPAYEGIDWAEIHYRELANARVQYHSFYGWRRDPFLGQTITIDDRGIRLTPGSEPADSDAPLVVFLGGSTMWGEGADDANTIPSWFLRKAGERLRVENLGESAYNAFQSYLFLRFRMLEGWRPDLVISYDGVNNVGGLCQAGNRPFGHGREAQMRNAMRGLDTPRIPEALTPRYFVLPVRELVQRSSRRLDPDWLDPFRLTCLEDPSRAVAVARMLLDSWKTTQELVESKGGEFIAILQPTAYLYPTQADHLRLEDALSGEYVKVYGLARRMLELAEYASLRPRVIDMADALYGVGMVYVDGVHLAPSGNEVIAAALLSHEVFQVALGRALGRTTSTTMQTGPALSFE